MIHTIIPLWSFGVIQRQIEKFNFSIDVKYVHPNQFNTIFAVISNYEMHLILFPFHLQARRLQL